LKIETCIYRGEKSRYSFETHVSIFKKAHLDIQKAGNKPDGRTKVRKFLQSIKAPELQTAVGVARSQDKYLTDFEETVNYLRRYVLPTSANRTVASVGARTQPPHQPAGLSHRWYKKEEFRALPKEHQTRLSYEKRRRDQLNKKSGKMEKNKIKATV
jgi:ethanolamine utilization cobalamin adenosyltransferase